jgi:microcystin degradation protein MlrC
MILPKFRPVTLIAASVQVPGAPEIPYAITLMQYLDSLFFEILSVDTATILVVAAKSSYHFRSGFDRFFRHAEVIKVVAQYLTNSTLPDSMLPVVL